MLFNQWNENNFTHAISLKFKQIDINQTISALPDIDTMY
jgi:hypothetical protein